MGKAQLTILLIDGRGFVKIDDWESFGLDEPYEQVVNSTYTEGVYMVSVFHQLHCLVRNMPISIIESGMLTPCKSYLAQHYQTAFEETKLTEEVAFHSAHCFDYLRQSIMCAADTSLEGKSDAGPGWGSKHECTDYELLLAWANKHTVFKWRNKLLPGEAVL